jgi:hypothetical protein
MFGKRSTTAATPSPRPDPVPAPLPAQSRVTNSSSRAPEAHPEPPAADKRQAGQIPAKAERKPVERAKSEEYYDVP